MKSNLKEIEVTATENGKPLRIETRLVPHKSYWVWYELVGAYVLAMSHSGNTPQTFFAKNSAAKTALALGFTESEFEVIVHNHNTYGWWYVRRKEVPDEREAK